MAIGASQGNVIASAFVRIQPEVSGFGPGLRQAIATDLLQLEKQSEGFVKKLQGSVGTATKVLATASATGVALFGGMAISAASQLQTIEKSFQGLFGGMEKGRKQFDKVFALAEVTPFEGGALAKNYQRFVASFKLGGMSIESAADRSLGILKTLADGGAALGASTENIDGFSLALSQTIGKGKLTGEEIRQFTNNLNGFNVAGQVATYMYGDSLPASMDKFYKEMRAGKITSDIAIESILKGLREIPGAAGASERQLRTMAGAMSTVKDVFQRASFDGMGEALDIFANATVDSTESLRTIFKTTSEGLGDILITGVDIGQRVLKDFDSLFGKFIDGNIQTYKHLLGGASDGLLQSFKQFDRLGRILLSNQPFIFQLGKSLGQLANAFATFYVNVIEAGQPLFKSFTVLFDLFTDGFSSVNEILNSTVLSSLSKFGHEFYTTILVVKEAFADAFGGMGSSTTNFFKNLLGLASGVESILSVPFRFIRKSADDIAEGFARLTKEAAPSLDVLKGSILNVSESFSKFLEAIDIENAADFLISFVKNLIEGFSAISNYGAIAIDILTGFMNILEPLIGTLGELPAQLLSAFAIFKITNSPLLAMISLFKDFDTGMLVFFVTLTKVIPLINQLQRSMASLKATNFAGSIASMFAPIQGPKIGKMMPASAFAAQLGLGGRKEAGLLKMLQQQGLADKNIFDKGVKNQITDQMGMQKNLRSAIGNVNQGYKDLNGTMQKGSKISEGYTRTNQRLNAMFLGGTGAATKFKGALDAGNISLGRHAKASGDAAKGLGDTAKQGAAAGQGLTGAAGTASKMGAALSSVGGIATSLGLGIGISMFTAHLADSAAKAAALKASIDDTKQAALSFLTATSAEGRQSGINAMIEDIRTKMPTGTVASAAFTNALVQNGISLEDYAVAATKADKASVKLVKSTNNAATANLFKGVDRDVFENSSRIGGKNISDKVENEARAFIQQAIKVGADVNSMGRQINLSDAAVQKTLRAVAKQKGLDVEKTMNEVNGGVNDYVRDQTLKKLGYDNIFTREGGAVQFQGDESQLQKNINAMTEGQKEAIAAAKEYEKQELANGKVMKANLAVFEKQTEARKIAMKAAGDYFNILGEANSKENLALMNTFSSSSLKGRNLTNFDFSTSKEGIQFASVFQQLTETEASIIKNTQKPISQQFDSLVKSNEQFDLLAKNAGLLPEQVNQLRANMNNLSVPEDFAQFVNDLRDENSGLTGTQIKSVVAKAFTLSKEDQKRFVDSIANDDLRKKIQAQLKDLEGNVLLSLGTEALDSATRLREQNIGGKGKDSFKTAFDPGSVKGLKNLTDYNTFSAGVLDQQKKINQEFQAGTLTSEQYQKKIAETNALYSDTFDELTKSNPILLSRLKVQQGETKNYIDMVNTLTEGKTAEQTTAFRKTFMQQFGEVGTTENFPLRFSIQYGLDPATASTDLSKTLDAEFAKSKKDNKKANILIGIDNTAIAESVKGFSADKIMLKVFPELDPAERANFIEELAKLNPKVVVELITNNKLSSSEIAGAIPALSDEELKTSLAAVGDKKILAVFAKIDDESLKKSLAQIPDERLIDILPTMKDDEFIRSIGQLPTERLITLIPDMPAEKVALVLQNLPPEKLLEVVPTMSTKDLAAAVALIPTESFNKLIPQMDTATLALVTAQMTKEQFTKVLPTLDPASKNKMVAEMTQSQITSVFPKLTPDGKKAFLESLALINPELATTLRITQLSGNTKFIVDGSGNITGSRGGNVRLVADGDIFTRATSVIAGEAGAEAIIPMTRPKRALELLKQSGLYDLALTHAQSGKSSSSTPYSVSGPIGGSTDHSITNNIKVEMNNTRTTDPEGMALLLASRLTNGIRR